MMFQGEWPNNSLKCSWVKLYKLSTIQASLYMGKSIILEEEYVVIFHHRHHLDSLTSHRSWVKLRLHRNYSMNFLNKSLLNILKIVTISLITIAIILLMNAPTFCLDRGFLRKLLAYLNNFSQRHWARI